MDVLLQICCIHKNLATSKSLCNLQELYTAFKEKHTDVNIGFSKFCALRTSVPCPVSSVCVCGARQNVVLLVDAIDWDLIKLSLSYFKYFH